VAATTRKSKLTPSTSPSGELLKLTSKLVARRAAKHLPALAERGARVAKHLPALAERGSNGDGAPLLARIRSIPIQCSIDIAVPLEVAYAEWMKLEFLPEGAHRIEHIKRRGDRLQGRIAGALAQHSAWRAEVREERPDESFAWRSVKGSDCLGLATFHRLSERLTRIEVELDVVPVGPAEAFELLVHIADRRAETDLRRFKAQLERISPEDYPSLVEDAGDAGDSDNDEED
jgi:uncharacterized membrane protein